ncbi:MAG: hypothetical protein NTV06_03650 [candidate division Zixibacteria bacterium]|nr:hypothetical protein [candidate division Zixibacteria bacterium]
MRSIKFICLYSLLFVLFFLFPVRGEAKITLPISPLDFPVGTMSKEEMGGFADNNVQDTIKSVSMPSKSISRTKAVVLSLLLPGAGHFYIGEKGRGEIFTGSEVVIWAGFFAFRTYGEWKKDDYIRLAQSHAGIDPNGKNDDFYKYLTFYDNRDDYNKWGRVPDAQAPYYPPGRAFYWQWDSQASQDSYRAARNSSKSAFRKAIFMIGAAVVNRIVSGIDVLRLTNKAAPQEEEDDFSNKGEKIKFKVRADLLKHKPSVSIALSRRF